MEDICFFPLLGSRNFLKILSEISGQKQQISAFHFYSGIKLESVFLCFAFFYQ